MIELPGFLVKLTYSHPPLSERVAAIKKMKDNPYTR